MKIFWEKRRKTLDIWRIICYVKNRTLTAAYLNFWIYENLKTLKSKDWNMWIFKYLNITMLLNLWIFEDMKIWRCEVSAIQRVKDSKIQISENRKTNLQFAFYLFPFLNLQFAFYNLHFIICNILFAIRHLHFQVIDFRGGCCVASDQKRYTTQMFAEQQSVAFPSKKNKKE